MQVLLEYEDESVDFELIYVVWGQTGRHCCGLRRRAEILGPDTAGRETYRQTVRETEVTVAEVNEMKHAEMEGMYTAIQAVLSRFAPNAPPVLPWLRSHSCHSPP